MRASGVICELNPFHNGHAYLLSRMRESVGDDGCVVCLMSGRFVQRGTAAMADPYLRADMALAGGADLVIELPFPWSAGSAEHFSAAGVRILSRLGVESIAFGSESGDTARLQAAAHAVDDPRFAAIYAAACRRGVGTTVAYAEALRTVAGVKIGDDGFPSSNDLLGIGYLRALAGVERAHGYAPQALIVPRVGSRYRDTVLTAGAYPSATALRAVIAEAACDPVALRAILEDTMPDEAFERLIEAIAREDAPTDETRLMTFYHTYYRLQKADILSQFAECGGGLAAHMVRVAQETATAEEFFTALRTKQYTDARLRRALLFGVVGVIAEDLRVEPSYTTLLAANARGCAFLKSLRECGLVVTKPADAPDGRQKDFGGLADALFTLCFPTPRVAGDMRRRSPIIR